MKEYKLKYNNKQEALQDLMAKSVIVENLSYNEEEELELRETPYTDITEAVVYNIQVPDKKATYDDQGEILTEATFVEGYHVDVMLNKEVDFGENEVVTNNPKHTFG